MPRFASSQEELVYSLSGRVLGRQVLFCPELYGKEEALKEPADIAWVANRCAILMYMNRSVKKSAYDKARHNLRQLRRWLRVWKNGEKLVGIVGNKKLSFAFSDIDHVIGLSVIGGEHVYCKFHHDKVSECRDLKLSACATIGENAFNTITSFYVGPREIVFWLDFLKQDRREYVPEDEFNFWVRSSCGQIIKACEEQWPEGAASSTMPDTIDLVRRLLTWAKSDTTDSDEIVSACSDLTMLDAVWLALATSALQSRMPKVGQYGPMVVRARRDAGPYRLNTIMAANARALSEQVPAALDTYPGVSLLTALDAESQPSTRFFVLNPWIGPSCLENEIASLRDSPQLPLA